MVSASFSKSQQIHQNAVLTTVVSYAPQAPLAGVTILHADITVPATLSKMMDAMEEEKADLVVCDGAPEGKLVSTEEARISSDRTRTIS
jgi:23S rRNA U2552 (ribose-2'-O)-methylase RlmE/FtsJ